MIKNPVSIRQVIEVLNFCVKLDRQAMEQLIAARTICNRALANHPTVQVGSHRGKFVVGLLGILNGLFGAAKDGSGAIAAIFGVDCPNGHKVKLQRVGDKCKLCRRKLRLGRLIKFKQIRN